MTPPQKTLQLCRGYSGLKTNNRKSVVTIGNFDGLHLGHQALLEMTAERARQNGWRSVVLSFEPLPSEFFAGNKAPARLSNLRQKICLLEKVGIDAFHVMRFNKQLASMSADDFVRRVLVDGLHAKEVYVGSDFRYGAARAGDFSLLQAAGLRYGFTAVAMDDFCHKTHRVSSTRVREALSVGEFKTVRSLLGRPFTMDGKVRHGQKLGRKLGFPTINVLPQRHKVPVQGIFAVQVHGIVADKPWPGVASLGSRPSISGNNDEILEVHLFDFNGDLYGRHVEVEFVEKIRNEIKFDDLDDLIVQIERDVQLAKVILESETT